MTAVLPTPFGALGLRESDGALKEILFLPPGLPPQAPTTVAGIRFASDLRGYLTDPDTPFHLPIPPTGTEFQRRVWQAIAAIPRGEVRTYGELARLLGSAPRAVGQACGANPYPLAIACHRVVSRQGIGGFAGATQGHLLASKRWLLIHEGAL